MEQELGEFPRPVSYPDDELASCLISFPAPPETREDEDVYEVIVKVSGLRLEPGESLGIIISRNLEWRVRIPFGNLGVGVPGELELLLLRARGRAFPIQNFPPRCAHKDRNYNTIYPEE